MTETLPRKLGTPPVCIAGELGSDHVCRADCTARFYEEVMGCEVQFEMFEQQGECCCVGALHRVETSITGRLPPLIHRPAQRESWTASKAVIEHMRTRGWRLSVETTPDWLMRAYFTSSDPQLTSVGHYGFRLDGFPRGLGLAAWRAHYEELRGA